MPEPLVRIPNRHPPSCGRAPPVAGDDPDVYVGYFEGPQGDQWVFTYDRRTGAGRLSGGDVGWATSHVVTTGQASGLALSAPESAWLEACWRAATADSCT